MQDVLAGLLRPSWPDSLSADANQAGHSGPRPRFVAGLPELRPWAPQNVTGACSAARAAGGLPGQGGERAHEDCVHMGHKQANAQH